MSTVKRTFRKTERGYTLVEMIVSLGIFTLVMMVAAGAYVSLIELDRRSRATNDLVTNLSFTTESMSRAIRTGTGYSCSDTSAIRDANGNSNDGSCHQITFQDTTLGSQVSYIRKSNGTVGQCIGAGVCNDSSAIPLTDSRIYVKPTGLTFYVRGVGTGDGTQPWMTFTIVGELKNSASTASTTFAIQSSATQRLTE